MNVADMTVSLFFWPCGWLTNPDLTHQLLWLALSSATNIEKDEFVK